MIDRGENVINKNKAIAIAVLGILVVHALTVDLFLLVAHYA